MKQRSRRIVIACSFVFAALLGAAAVRGQGPSFLPNGAEFPNPAGTAATYSATNSIDLTGPFFQDLGTNGRSCATCHQPSDGMSVSAAHVEQRFTTTGGLDPIFHTNDGSNCNVGIDVSTVQARSAAYSLLRTRGLIRVAIDVPQNADFQVTGVENPYGCGDTHTISMYRRPLPATNLRFLSTVMWDGRESSPLTGTEKIVTPSYPADYHADALEFDLSHQSVDATNGHAQGSGSHPTVAEQQQIVDFEMGLTTAQASGRDTGRLDAQDARGGALVLLNQPFFISINSSISTLGFEQPGGSISPGVGAFTPLIFNMFDGWSGLPYASPRAAVARGEALFNSKPITITDVAGINDDLAIASLTGTCGTCHDSPNVGNHSFPTPLNIGVGDFGGNGVSKGGLDISYLPQITVCRTSAPADCKTTTDVGQALIDGKFDHVGKLKGPILRGLSARAPYFHNGSAQTLLDVVRFYEVRFGVVFTPREETDLVAFLSSL
jgi:cytochrome c peroxidase